MNAPNSAALGLQLVIIFEDWAHAHIAANAVAKSSATCKFKIKASEVQAIVRAVYDRTHAEVGEVRHCTIEVTHPTEPDELVTLQLQMQVAVVVG